MPGRGDGPEPSRGRWYKPWLWLAVLYLGFFLILSFQDRAAVPEAVSYSEFKSQVQSNNVAEVFSRGDTIEGKLRQQKPVPGAEGQSYTEFVTERPTFANDNLLGALEANDVTVRATPLVQERGVLVNLLISIAPVALLVLFYLWLLKRQSGPDWTRCHGRQEIPARESRKHPRHLP